MTLFYNLKPSLKQLKLIIQPILKRKIIIVVTRKVITQVHRNIVILGGSTMKHVTGYEMLKKIENYKVCIKSFSGPKVRLMKDYIKPLMRKKLDHTILHVGTNDLNSNRPSDLIAKSIVDLTITLKNNSQNVSVSNIIMRNDNFTDKFMEINGYLKQFFIERNIFLIEHTKTIHSRNINRSKLHLNKSDSLILSNNFVKAISSIFH